jgi:DNA segregation ATPase FtsK/SpoIIIE, S-DNA-T family
MQLRSNLGNRLVLKVAEEATSMIALTAKGGERLLGRGHLVAKVDGEPELIYLQVPYLSDDQFAVAAAALQADVNA